MSPQSSTPAPVVVFAGGGTGGHIYPALAIAEQLVRLRPDARCVFLCSDRPLDARILASEGAAPLSDPLAPLPERSFISVAARPFGLRPGAFLRFARSWGTALRLSRRLIRDLRRPSTAPSARVVVVAMGGYVAAPAARAAALEGADLTLVNLDAVPGKANRWIARLADRALTTTPVTGDFARDWVPVRPIVRDRARADRSREQCRADLARRYPQLAHGTRTLVVTGGSQGARSINLFMRAFVREHAGAFVGWQVAHQCGPGGTRESSAEALRDAYARAGVAAVVEEFVTDMATWWGAADCAVSRAGAGSVAEVWANRVPALFLPYPYHRDQHQKLNAAPLVDAGAAALRDDHIDPDKTLASVAPTLTSLLTHPDKLAAMRAALHKLGPADGAASVARVLSAALGAARPTPT
jgi:UDP-N-acetylglucosamine--N-acetylmuramyl-(pentapeptide) pyrophosphoryl-undecaprenol N-acetylglucosamine transferase